MSIEKLTVAKPFLKWAGGKSQLINEIENNLPKEIFNRKFTFIEPFVGSGAVFFWIMSKFSNIEKAVINDINTDLTDCFLTVKEDLNELIEILDKYQTEYHAIFNDLEKAK